MIPAHVLQRIQDRLAHDDVLTVIEQFAPRTLTDAITWARCRPLWDEYRSQFTDQTIGIAATISQRAMKEHRLSFDDNGRVVQQTERKEWRTPEPSMVFSMEIDGQPVRVQYTKGYFPAGDTDYLSFLSPHDPVQPHPLSETGYLSHFCLASSVAACGGPEAYARMFTQARLEGRDKEFVAAFEGVRQELKPQRKAKRIDRSPVSAEPKPVIGEHTAAVVEEKPQQGMLF